jgi:multicomponent Na+:H+ antiporter subunit D
MGMGAVIHVTGRQKMTDLQGRQLYRKMPITLGLYMVGAFSISAVPLFNGFISKTMVVAAAGELHRPAIELLLHLASVGTFLHTGLKLPWGTWFGKHKGSETEIAEAKEPPFNMLLAMGIGAFLCFLTGIYPKLLYDLLPYPVEYHPYAASHVIGMLQLLLLTLAAFWIYIDHLGGEPFISVDTDWFYRIFGRKLLRFCSGPLSLIRSGSQFLLDGTIKGLRRFSLNPYYALERLWLGDDRQYTPADTAPPEYSTHRFPLGFSAFFSLVLLCIFIVVALF